MRKVSGNAPQGSHFYLLTLVGANGTHSEAYGTLTLKPGATRLEVFEELRAQALENFPGGCVIAFSLEPNTPPTRPGIERI